MPKRETITKDGTVNGNVMSITINWDGEGYFEALLYLDDAPHVLDWNDGAVFEAGQFLDGQLDDKEVEMLVALGREAIDELRKIASKKKEEE